VARLHSQLGRAPTGPLSENEQSLIDALRLKYRDIFVLATEELQLAQQVLGELQKICAKHERKEKNKKSKTGGAGAGTAALMAAVEAPKQPTRPSSSSKRVDPKLDVWSHEGRILQPGTPVAALTDPHSNPPLWIIASVVKYLGSERKKPMYEVVDDDPDGARKHYLLEPKRLICLPSLAQVPLSKRREFAKGERVLAVFPGTTVLYPATVLGPPNEAAKTYPLMFDDDDGLHRDIEAGLVVPLPPDYGVAPPDD